MARQIGQPVDSFKLQAPRQLTTFIGRQQEIAKLTLLLNNPTCRLLTLVGPGGVGKTRLAIQAAAQVADDFPHSVSFVPLQSIQSADFLVSAVADVLDVPLAGQAEPIVQLRHYLRNKQMLLLLDNFEQLLDEGGRAVLLQILEAAPKLKLLITSREALNLQEEWLYPVAGLAVPASTHLEDWADHDAVKLLVERVGRVRRDFSLETEAEGIVRLCQLVEGMPLAIELAATWIKNLTCADVADEIQHSLEFLSTPLRDMPERHRSMEAVFDQAWQRLTPEEQDIFARLSVFRGGFRREAAKTVAGATLPVLTALVDKSLLRWEPDGQRYQVHELLRQYATDQLSQTPDEIRHSHNTLCDYYTRFLQQRFVDIRGGRQRETLEEIRKDLDNIRVAWQWAVRQNRLQAIREMGQVLGLALMCQSRHQEGLQIFREAVDHLHHQPAETERDRTLITLLVFLGWNLFMVGRMAESHAVWIECQEHYTELDIPPLPFTSTDPALAFSGIALAKGDYAKAVQYAQQALHTSQTHNQPWNEHSAHSFLTRFYLYQGQLETAVHHGQEACAISREIGDRWYEAHCLLGLGDVLAALGDYDAAAGHYMESYTIWEEFNDRGGMAAALNYHGNVALQHEKFSTAVELFRRSLQFSTEVNSARQLILSLTGLGSALLGQGEIGEAAESYRKALKTAVELHHAPLIVTTLVGIGNLLLQTGYKERGAEVLELVYWHPGSGAAVKEQAQKQMAAFDIALPTSDPDTGRRNKKTSDLNKIVPILLAELTTPIASSAERLLAATDVTGQSLLEPLSERELEVLQLIGEGLTNQQIADRLFIVVGTVKKHTSNIYGKLGVNNRTQAVAHARELNLLE